MPHFLWEDLGLRVPLSPPLVLSRFLSLASRGVPGNFGAVMSRVCPCTLVTDMLETTGGPVALPKTIEVMASASAFGPT